LHQRVSSTALQHAYYLHQCVSLTALGRKLGGQRQGMRGAINRGSNPRVPVDQAGQVHRRSGAPCEPHLGCRRCGGSKVGAPRSAPFTGRGIGREGCLFAPTCVVHEGCLSPPMCVVHYKPERTPKRPTFIISTEDTGPPKICLFMPVDQRRHIEFPMLGAVPHQSGSIFASQPPSSGLSNKDGASNSPRRLGIFLYI
jgi:hypothetical protein